MANSVLLLLLLLPVAFVLYNLFSLFLNYRIARKIGIPVIVLPAGPDNPVWMLTSGTVLAVVKAIFGDCSVSKYGRLGWEYHDKAEVHVKHGDAVVLVTPSHNWIYVCNAEAFNEIFQRRSSFPRPPEMLGMFSNAAFAPMTKLLVTRRAADFEMIAMLDVFGPNISTANGADWQRHRKITSTPFNEQNSHLVWIEALRQADEVLQFWKSLNMPIRRTAKDTRTLSLHVLSGAGFGKSYSFQKSREPPKPGHLFNYRDSLALILENTLLILILGPKFLTNWFLPKSWVRIGQATVDFKFHMVEMVEEEKRLIAEGKPGGGNIINSLLRASEDISKSPTSAGSEGSGFRGLTEDEIYGNIFVYNFAGHDTMAITLNWALYLLAAHPEIQDWISEEINAVIKNDHSSTWNYQDVFPKLNRCLAVLLETLRLWDPLIGIAKSTGEVPQPLTLNGRETIIPARSRVILNINAIHTHPKYWGPDGLVWRPNRWILSESGTAPPLAREYLRTPPKGAYVPWSDGARVCPGKKFGQVEFVASMVALFRKHRVEVMPEKGESQEEARKRALEVVLDSRITLLLQMRNPESVALRWSERG